jgi:3-oxoacyl-[acyl-carrier-protein] synthase-1
MVTSVGLNAAATCAAVRAGVRNMSETRFLGAGGEPLFAAQVPLPLPWRGRTKLVKMLAASVTECLAHLPVGERQGLPVLLGLAENDRPGRLEGLEDIVTELEAETGTTFSREYTAVLPLGRVSGLVAIARARALMNERGVGRVVVAGVDSLLVSKTLSVWLDQDRLLTTENSNGFIPGEAAACVLLEEHVREAGTLTCLGVGFAREPVPIASEEPFRAEGLTRAIAAALTDAGTALDTCGVRLTDLSGEHYYFREAALALSRLLRHEGARELWHPAECVGDVGAAIGPLLLGYAAVAASKGFLPGPRVLVHASADSGERAAACLALTGQADGE